MRGHEKRRIVQKDLQRVWMATGVCSLHEREGSMGRAKSRAGPDYTINRISADRAEPRIK